jgi:Fe-S cluster assembly protein SufD
MDRLFNYLDTIEKSYQQKLVSSNHNKLKEFQLRALDAYGKLPNPDPRERSWSHLAKLDLDKLDLDLAPQPESINQKPIEKDAGRERDYSGSIHINQDTVEYYLDEALLKKGVIFCDLLTAAENHLDLLNSFSEAVGKHNEKIGVITAGISRHGFLLYIPRNVQISDPLEVVNNITAGNTLLPLSGYILLDAQAEATLVMKDTSEKKAGKNSVMAMNLFVKLQEDSTLRFMEIQQVDKKAWTFINEHVQLGKQAKLERFTQDEGAKVNRRSFSVALTGEGGQANITSVYAPKEDQVYVYDTEQMHLASHTNSDLLYSGVLDDRAYSFWRGNVYVAEGTKGADGFQINKNLLLKESTHAESIPGLEIIADEVRCSHAVTVSSIDPEQVFYLNSRGIETDEAERLIVDGFMQAAVVRIKDKKFSKIIEEELN